MTEPENLGGIFVIDTRHGGLARTVGVFVVPLEDGRFVLVETGPGSTLASVRGGIRTLGFDLGGLAAILVTHIHLDHAGAAGALARESGATVVVHDRGAPHLIAPDRLLASATRIYGDAMERLWGAMLPVPEDQIHSVSGGETIALGGRSFGVIEAAGHARHHVAFHLDDGSLFTGDAAAIKLPGSSVIRPALPPPETDLEAWQGTIERLRALTPRRLLLTHFGEVAEADRHLVAVLRRNRLWADEVLAGLRAGESDRLLEQRVEVLSQHELREDGAGDAVIAAHRVSSSAAMTVMGLKRYWHKHHPEALVGAPRG